MSATSETARLTNSPSENLAWLSFPAADTPSICESRTFCSAEVAHFSSDVWPMNALTDDATRPLPRIGFHSWTPEFRLLAKHVAYALINYGNPEGLAEKSRKNYVKWPQPSTILNFLGRLKYSLDWLHGEWSELHPDTPVHGPHDLDPGHLSDCRRRIDGSGMKPDQKWKHLETLTRVWHLNPWLPPDLQWPEPPWGQWDEASIPARSENRTKPISQETMGPLLEWSTAFITAFKTDIFAAHNELQERVGNLPTGPQECQAARDVLAGYLHNGQQLPLQPSLAGTKRSGDIGWKVLSYRHGIDSRYFGPELRRMSASPQVSADASLTALDLTLDGLFHGRQWMRYIGVYDVDASAVGRRCFLAPLLSHLRTAAIIVCGYLTGARPEEICGWKHGAAPAPILSDKGSYLHLIHGQVWKGRRAQDSGAPGLAQDAVWATIPAATTAIHVAEQVNGLFGRQSGLLFSDTGVQPSPGMVARWIQEFIDFINDRLVPECIDPVGLEIPPDPNGPITLRRFRRTLAWFVHNRPNGEATTAIQYQHVGTLIGGGYAGTKESGMRDLMLEEDWAHRRSTMMHVRDLLDVGEGVSGPGAQRAIAAISKLPRNLTPADERRLRKEGQYQIYDNPAAIALCIFHEPDALCRKVTLDGKVAQPSLLECVDGCRNCARTDDQLRKLESEAATCQANATLSPLPLAQAFLERSNRNLLTVRQFRSQRFCLEAKAEPGKLLDE